MNPLQPLDSLDFDHNQLLNEQIKAIPKTNGYAFVEQREWFLLLELQASLGQGECQQLSYADSSMPGPKVR